MCEPDAFSPLNWHNLCDKEVTLFPCEFNGIENKGIKEKSMILPHSNYFPNPYVMTGADKFVLNSPKNILANVRIT